MNCGGWYEYSSVSVFVIIETDETARNSGIHVGVKCPFGFKKFEILVIKIYITSESMESMKV